MSLPHNKKGSFFLKYYLVFSTIILAGFLIIGIALMAFVTSFLRSETLDGFSRNAETISSMTTKLLASATVKRNPEGAAMMLYKTINITADCTGSDVFICDRDGKIIACRDIMSNKAELSDILTCPYHSELTVPDTVIARSRNAGYAEFSEVGGLYSELHAVAVEPIYDENNDFYGSVVITSPIKGEFLESFGSILSMFLFAALISLCLVAVLVYFMTDRMTKPIRELAAATRCYAAGDFSHKVPELGTGDELSELITEFNAMSVSLSDLENSRRSFVANVSHEFKTPMTTIGGFINGILDGTIPPEKQSYYLTIVSSEVKRLSRMVNMMLNISKIETGNINLKIEQYKLSDKLIQSFLGFEQLISDKNITVTGLEDLPAVTVRADSDMLNQVIYNLLDNAVKFTDQNGSIGVNAAEDAKFVYFSVTNSGKGIPKEALNRVFDRFYKVDQSRSTDVKSTGLGLYLVKSIIELHGGTIKAESETDVYTRFTITLPK